MSIRMQLLLLQQAAETFIEQTSLEEPLSIEEVTALARSVDRLEEFLRLDQDLTESD